MWARQLTFCATLIVVLSGSVAAESDKALKIALIADNRFDLRKSPLVSLLEVGFSQRDRIQLLERTQIDKILQEQKLTVAGCLRVDSYPNGRLLLRHSFETEMDSQYDPVTVFSWPFPKTYFLLD